MHLCGCQLSECHWFMCVAKENVMPVCFEEDMLCFTRHSGGLWAALLLNSSELSPCVTVHMQMCLTHVGIAGGKGES